MSHKDIRCARAGLTQVIEPADSLGVYAVRAWGPTRVLEIVQGSTPSQQDWIALSRLDTGDGQLANTIQKHLGEAIARWRRRRTYLCPAAALEKHRALGGHFLIPEDEHWPVALADLDHSEPLGLWTLGGTAIPPASRMIALVGSREATSYGSSSTTMLARAARDVGLTVLSGGAYGIDAQAHRAALEYSGTDVPTIAVLAGGLDRFYPAGNIQLLRDIAADGLLISEMPPGMRPNRYRFLNRNRVIAALAAATIVVEARYRSGALNTANHAHNIGRLVGAVPGPINVPTSAGCHRLMKETPTLLIDDPTDVANLFNLNASEPSQAGAPAHRRPHDDLSTAEMMVYDQLPVRSGTTVQHLSGLTGLSVPMITGVLAKLERLEIAVQRTNGWKKSKRAGV